MSRLILAAALVLSLSPLVARAEGCYTCGAGSSPQCRDYCRYPGADTFDARKTCEKKGCRIGSPTPCPSGGNAVICRAPAAAQPIIASIPWCAPDPKTPGPDIWRLSSSPPPST